MTTSVRCSVSPFAPSFPQRAKLHLSVKKNTGHRHRSRQPLPAYQRQYGIHKKAYAPLKNLPVVFLPENKQDNITEILRRKLSLFVEDLPAISLKGKPAPSYSEVKYLAKSIAAALKYYDKDTIVILLQSDFAKALGIVLQQYLPKPNIICLDNIKAHDGDYVDIGTPVNSVVPVAVKTLIFEQQQC